MHIALSVFTALFAAMILTNIVVSALWYKHEVQQQLDVTAKILKQVADKGELEEWQLLNAEGKKLVEELRLVVGGAVKQVVVEPSPMKNIGGEVSRSTKNDDSLKATVLKAARIERTVVEKLSGLESFFTIQPMYIAVAVPSYSKGGVRGGIGVLLSTKSVIDALWAKQRLIWVYILLNAIILATLVFFRMRKVLLDPVDKLVAQADSYQLKEGGGLFSDYSKDEFGQLSRAMRNMVSKIEKDRDRLRESVASLAEANTKLKDTQEELVHAEKLAALGRLSAGIAHEIGNPVAIVQGYLELIARQDVDEEERKQFMRRGLNELQRIDTLIRQLLEMARSSSGNHEHVDLTEELCKVLDLLQLQLSNNGIEVKVDLPDENCILWADRDKLRQVLMNFILNSIDAIGDKNQEDRKIEVDIGKESCEQGIGDTVVVRIRDNGIGIDKENLELIFEPFFTTKDPGKGTGLGLAVANRIIRSFDGSVKVLSTRWEGTEFILTFPSHTPR